MHKHQNSSSKSPSPRSDRPAPGLTTARLIALAAFILGGLAIVATAYYLSWKLPASQAPAPVATDSEITQSATGSVPSPVAPAPAPTPQNEHRGQPDHNTREDSVTVSADLLLKAAQSRGWRPLTEPTRVELGPGSVQLHARLNKNQYTVNLTLFQFTDFYSIQDIVNKTKAPGEAIIFGTTVARVTPDDSSALSANGSRELAKTMREFKSIANHR